MRIAFGLVLALTLVPTFAYADDLIGGVGIETLGRSPDNDLLLAMGADPRRSGDLNGGAGTDQLGANGGDDNDTIRNGGDQGGHCSSYCGSGFDPSGSGEGIRGGMSNDHLNGSRRDNDSHR